MNTSPVNTGIVPPWLQGPSTDDEPRNPGVVPQTGNTGIVPPWLRDTAVAQGFGGSVPRCDHRDFQPGGFVRIQHGAGLVQTSGRVRARLTADGALAVRQGQAVGRHQGDTQRVGSFHD